MKKIILKLTNWIAAAAFFLTLQQISQDRLFAPDLPAKKETFVLRGAPRKIFMPGSSIAANAAFVLSFDNPEADIVTQAKIFDLTGAETADMREETASGSDPARLSWDGRGKDGAIVRSGVYLYRIEAGGQIINGAVAVVR